MTYSVVDISHFSNLNVQLLFCWLLDNVCFAFSLIILVLASLFLF